MKTSFISLLIATAVLVSAAPNPRPLGRRAVSPDGGCGGSQGYSCPTTGDTCCSQWGYCGNSVNHCGAGCQAGFGTCTGTGGTTPPTQSPPSTPGPSNPPSTGSRPALGSVPYGTSIKSCSRTGVIALTFDDGPHATNTPPILDALKAAGFHATFFINGANWGPSILDPSSPAKGIIQRMIAEGHQIGSHTWSHPDLSTLSASAQESQMTQLESALLSIIGKYPTYMRPPYFSCSGTCMSTMSKLGYHVIDADLDTFDYNYNTPATNGQAQANFDGPVNAAVKDSSSFNVLMHDVHDTTASLLVPHIIQTMKAKGFTGATIGECLNDPPENWYRTA